MKYKFLVTATVKKIIEVELDSFADWTNEDAAIAAATDLAYEQFSVAHDGTEEYYSEDAEFIVE